jgi:CRISPR/Cas system-associated exonuclease Cas4 (RecB family)
MALVHSYSAVKDFEGCGRRYHQVRILKRFKQQDTDATLYGSRVHKAFEEFIRDGKPLPENLAHYARFVEPLTRIGGDIRCEEKLGIREDFSPCGFFDKDVWFRGIPDYLAVNGETARVVDYKTGKSSRYADTAQLELMAAMIMAHRPAVQIVKGALLFVVAGDIVRAVYRRAELPEIFSRWVGRADAVAAAIEQNVWNARPSGLCKFCPVSGEACEHK